MSSFVDLLKNLGIPSIPTGHEHCRPGWLQVDCPWCSRNSQHWRLGYNLAFRYMNCWSCGPHGVVAFLAEVTGKPYSECKRLFDDVGGSRAVREEVPRGKLVLPTHLCPLTEAHRDYLYSRNYDPTELESLWRLKSIGFLNPDLKFRIFIPVYFQGEVVSWTTRKQNNDGIRYWSARASEEKINHKDLLYGEDFVRHNVIVCEGPTDVWRVGPGAVATFGTGFSRAQMARLACRTTRAICFDNEPMAQRRALALADQLSAFPGETFNVRLDAKDPGSATLREIKKLRKHFLGD